MGRGAGRSGPVGGPPVRSRVGSDWVRALARYSGPHGFTWTLRPWRNHRRGGCFPRISDPRGTCHSPGEGRRDEPVTISDSGQSGKKRTTDESHHDSSSFGRHMHCTHSGEIFHPSFADTGAKSSEPCQSIGIREHIPGPDPQPLILLTRFSMGIYPGLGKSDWALTMPEQD